LVVCAQDVAEQVVYFLLLPLFVVFALGGVDLGNHDFITQKVDLLVVLNELVALDDVVLIFGLLFVLLVLVVAE